MEHSEALERNAVERYLLGELTGSQRDAFEEHYFGCTECATEVKAAAAFIDNAREAMRRAAEARVVQQPHPAPRSWWLGWLRPAFAVSAVAVLAATVAYQNLVTIPQIRHDLRANVAQPLSTLSLVTSGARGAGDKAEIAVRPDSSFGIFVDIPASDRFTSYACEIRTAEGQRRFSINVSAAQAKDAVELLIPGATLSAGKYEVVVLGNGAAGGTPAGEEVARYAFVVKNLP